MAMAEKTTGPVDIPMEVEDSANVSPTRAVLRSVTVVDFAIVTPDLIIPAVSSKHTKYGNYAQWAGVIAAILLGLLNMALIVSYHNESKTTVTSDEHIKLLIAGNLDPAVKAINERIDNKLDPINKKLDDLAGKVDDAQGQLKRLKSDVSEQAQKQGQILAINRIQDPERILGIIRAEIQMAETSKMVLPASQLADYKTALHALSPSVSDYWTTLAAIINYQSLVNQMSGEAPDPAKIAKPCLGENSSNNLFVGVPFRNCVIVLDNETFDHATFQNSVVIYYGGPVSLRDTKFVNCRFVLELPAQHEIPAEKSLLLALLDSPDQKSVQVSR